jgi:curli biogenesis system outer membrane secretion channel CsgG
MDIRKFLVLTACALALMNFSEAHAGKKKKAERAAAEAQAMLESFDCTDPKKRVAVLEFGSTGKYGSFEGWDVGEALAAQLSTALDQTDCFVLADRMALSEVLREQELGLAGVASAEYAAEAGRLIGAQILIKGEITEFEPGKQGRGMTAGFGLEDVGLRLGGNRNKVHIAADIRLIDASTGEVLATQRIDSEAKSFGIAFGIDYKDTSLGNDSFSKTPLGLAVRDAVIEAAGFIVEETREVEWIGSVVHTEEGSIYINAGAESDIDVGDTFVVSTVERELIDPATGVTIGRIEHEMGQVRVDAVEPRFAVATLLTDFTVRRGDLVRGIVAE